MTREAKGPLGRSASRVKRLRVPWFWVVFVGLLVGGAVWFAFAAYEAWRNMD